MQRPDWPRRRRNPVWPAAGYVILAALGFAAPVFCGWVLSAAIYIFIVGPYAWTKDSHPAAYPVSAAIGIGITAIVLVAVVYLNRRRGRLSIALRATAAMLAMDAVAALAFLAALAATAA